MSEIKTVVGPDTEVTIESNLGGLATEATLGGIATDVASLEVKADSLATEATLIDLGDKLDIISVGGDNTLLAKELTLQDVANKIDAVDAKLFNFNEIFAPSSTLPDGSSLTSQRTTLFDGKILNSDDPLIWGNTGTGSSVYRDSLIDFTASGGTYIVSQSKRYMPYFSGKPQIVEFTTQNFHTQPGITKRVGYFSSSAVTPYDSIYDGFWIEDDGTTKYIKAANKGRETVSIPLSVWGPEWASYDFENFSVFQFYFLWLGGAALIGFGVIGTAGFKVMAKVDFAGAFKDTICLSPNQPVRYEIRSTAGNSGIFTRICSSISTAGSIKESGKLTSSINLTPVTCNTIGTIYALKGIKKLSTRRDLAIKLASIACISNATNDAGILMLLLSPTLSAPLSYATVGNISEASGTGQTVTDVGRILYAIPAGQESSGEMLLDDYLTWLSIDIDDVPQEYVLAFLASTTNQSRLGVINLIEYL